MWRSTVKVVQDGTRVRSKEKNIAFTPFNNILSKLDENSWNMVFPVSGIFSKESHQNNAKKVGTYLRPA